MQSRNGSGTPGGGRTAVRYTLAALLLAAVGTGIVVVAVRPTLDDAQAALDRGELDTAQRIATSLLRRRPSNEALLFAARLASLQGRGFEASRLIRRVTVEEGPAGVETLLATSAVIHGLGRLKESEEHLRRAAERRPTDPETNERLLELMRLEGRNWEAQALAARLFPQRRFRQQDLELAATLDAVWITESRDGEYLSYCESVVPDDPRSQLGRIRILLARQLKTHLATAALQQAVASAPELLDAQALMGELLLDDDNGFLRWHAKLPSGAEHHPSIWVLRARWLHRQGDTASAVRCLWEAIKRFPNDRSANLLIAKLLVALGRAEASAPFLKRGELLLAFDDLLLRGGRSPETLRKMITLLERLERRWEARGWCELLLQAEPQSPFAQETIARLESALNAERDLTPDRANPAMAIDLAEYPIPRFPTSLDSATPTENTEASALSFRDTAREAGLIFRYFIEEPRLEQAVYTFDFAGGGASVLDYDCDGWPDLYLTQSSQWPKVSDSAAPRNALFRNLGGEFVEVAELARVGDQGFGMGAAVGDFNSDGFPDIYVANLGANALYLNHGDGTYEDATELSGTAGDDFSLSAAFADLSGDGRPDLYVVNYLAGDALERQCQVGGKRTQCSPLLFPGQPDQLYLNLGEGTFRDAAAQAGLAVPEGAGKGMGLVVADFDERQGLDVFVTNDTMSNFLYVNQGREDSIAFLEQGRLAGAAYDERGQLQGSMGIAAGDVNRDGMLDLFTTNFVAEPNNLFSMLTQEPSVVFRDLSHEQHLAQISSPKVGWGAQFLDGELDGDADLFVANGHLDENSAGPLEARMSPDLLENQGAAGFRTAPSPGDYFQSKYFGRAVARLDWNRDGLDDLCVTHRGAPVALLTNVSERRGHFIAVSLRGVTDCRDAIGAIVDVEAGGARWKSPVLAGDGFSAANQLVTRIGLGPHTVVDKLTIRWPNGSLQSFAKLPADREWIVVQNRLAPLSLPR